jgi:hypothetical protein
MGGKSHPEFKQQQPELSLRSDIEIAGFRNDSHLNSVGLRALPLPLIFPGCPESLLYKSVAAT